KIYVLYLHDALPISNDVIFTILPNGQIAFVSPAIERLTGHTQDELLGKALDHWVHPEDLEKYQAAIAAVVDRKKSQSMVEYRFRSEEHTSELQSREK